MELCRVDPMQVDQNEFSPISLIIRRQIEDKNQCLKRKINGRDRGTMAHFQLAWTLSK